MATQDQLYTGGASDWLEIYTNRRGAQRFTAGLNGSISSVKINIKKEGTPNDMVVSIYDKNGVSGAPDNLLASTEVSESSFGVGYSWVEIFFGTPATQVSGEDYFITIHQKSNGGDTSNSYWWRGGGGGVNAWWSSNAGSNWNSLGGGFNFETFISLPTTVWNDVNLDIRVVNRILDDLNCDIRVVDSIVVLRDINCNITTAERVFSDINCDIRAVTEFTRLRDINCNIRVLDVPIKDINCDIRVIQEGAPITGFLPDINCDIRVLQRTLSDINCDIRVIQDPLVISDINLDIRVQQPLPAEAPPPTPGVAKISPEPIGLAGFKVYLNSVEIEDVERDSIKWEWTFNETPAGASFRLARQSDNFNKTLDDISQAIINKTPIEIKFNNNLRYYGIVIKMSIGHSGETAVVHCLDRKHEVQEKLYDISYGRKWEFPEQGKLDVVDGDYPTTGQAITEILDRLISDNVIVSYTGVPTGITVEYQETEGMPAGTLISELLDFTGNYYWNITPNGVLQIFEAGNGTLKLLPLQDKGRQIHLYDVLDFDLTLNDSSNIVTELEVAMGTESEEERASFRLVGGALGLIPDWGVTPDNWFLKRYSRTGWGLSSTIEDYFHRTKEINRLLMRNEPEFVQSIGTKWKLLDWTDGSFIDNTFKSEVYALRGKINVFGEKTRPDRFVKIGGWSWGGQGVTLAQPLIKVLKTYNNSEFTYVLRTVLPPRLIGRFYKKETVSLATKPTIFNITFLGLGGVGNKRKASFTELGIRDDVAWSDFVDNRLVPKSEPGYDDTVYATDRANLMLSRINDPITEGNVLLTFDAFEYYNLNLGQKVNLTGTNETNIYKGNNGFPLDILSINFDVGSYIVTLNTSHIRNFVATKSFR